MEILEEAGGVGLGGWDWEGGKGSFFFCFWLGKMLDV